MSRFCISVIWILQLLYQPTITSRPAFKTHYLTNFTFENALEPSCMFRKRSRAQNLLSSPKYTVQGTPAIENSNRTLILLRIHYYHPFLMDKTFLIDPLMSFLFQIFCKDKKSSSSKTEKASNTIHCTVYSIIIYYIVYIILGFKMKW